MSKLTYLWSNGMVDNIARKVAEEPIDESLNEIKELLEDKELLTRCKNKFWRFGIA